MEDRAKRKIRVGTVVSDKMENTVVVSVERLVAHPRYGRRVVRTKSYKAHNEGNEARVGDRVRMMETRPLSKDKHWRVIEIIQRAK